MRILFLSNFYPPYELGGYEQLCHEVATKLTARGHDVAVLTSRHGSHTETDNSSPNIHRTLYLQADIAYYRPIDFFIRRPFQERANNRSLRSLMAEYSPDIALVWGMWNLSHNLPYLVEQQMPDRVLYYISSYWPMDLDPHYAYWQLPTRRRAMEIIKQPMRKLALAILRHEKYPPRLRFNHAICCSNFVRNTLIDAGYLPSNSGVVNVGIDVEPFVKMSKLRVNHDGKLRLLFFGRLIHDKGVHTAIEALALLKQNGYENRVELTILGSGHPSYEAKLRQMVIQLDISDQIKFIKQVPRDEIPAWLGKFDVCLFTSIWPEPMARTVMEAMAAGLLVIGTEVGGQVEMLVHGQNALTFQPEDAETLAVHIANVYNNPEMRLKLASAGQEMVIKKYTLVRMVNEIEQYLQCIVNNAPTLLS